MPEVKPRDGAAGAAEKAIFGRRESDHRAVSPFLHAARDEADKPLMPVRVAEHEAHAVLDIGVGERIQRLFLHAAFERLPLIIDVLKL